MIEVLRYVSKILDYVVYSSRFNNWHDWRDLFDHLICKRNFTLTMKKTSLKLSAIWWKWLFISHQLCVPILQKVGTELKMFVWDLLTLSCQIGHSTSKLIGYKLYQSKSICILRRVSIHTKSMRHDAQCIPNWNDNMWLPLPKIVHGFVVNLATQMMIMTLVFYHLKF